MAHDSERMTRWREMPLLGILGDVWNFLLFAMRRFINDGMTQAAGALTYSTLLAIVPLLVIAFAVLSGFPAFDTVKLRMEELVLGALVPEVGAGAKSYLTSFTRNASNLTTVGIVALAAAAVLLLSTIEATLNSIWHVERPRPLGRRLIIFWAVLTVGPLLFGASFTFTSDMASLARQWAWSSSQPETILIGSNVLKVVFAILMQSAAFTLLFKIVPARPVRFRHAVLGGIFSGTALQLLRWGFNLFLTSSSTYTTIYGAVAIFPIFLIWLYSCWTVVILGAVLAASFPDWWRRRDALADVELEPADRLVIAVALLTVLSRQAQVGGSVTAERLAEAVPLDARDEMIEALMAARYIVTTENQNVSLARDLHKATLADLARDMGLLLGRRLAPLQDDAPMRFVPANDEAQKALARLDTAETDILGLPIADLIDDGDAEPAADSLVALRKAP